MRAPIATAVLVVLGLTACSPDAVPAPLAPSAPGLAWSAQSGDDTRVKLIHGTLETTETGAPMPGTPIVVRHLEGEGIASHLGRFTVVGDFTLNLATASGGGSGAYTAANGDVLTVTTTGQAVVGGGMATVTETVTVTGGTGRFAGATGSLTVVRRIVQATGVSSGTIDGSIILPK